MTSMEAIALIVTALVVPFVVQLIKQQAIVGNGARWIAIGVSVLAGICAGFVGGIPDNAGAWVTCILATVGGVQVAYAAFKAVGITSKWMDALANVSTIAVPNVAATPPSATKMDDPLYVGKQQSLKDHAEDAQTKE